MLEKGDYILSDQCAVERKTVNDFVYTLTRRYLFEQLFRLKDVYPKSLIVLEGYLPIIYKYSSISPAAVWGAMFNLAKNGIAIVNTASQKETVDFLYTAARQEQVVEKKARLFMLLKNVIHYRMPKSILSPACLALGVKKQLLYWILIRRRLMRSLMWMIGKKLSMV
jgi:ERCC4-type nuclease